MWRRCDRGGQNSMMPTSAVLMAVALLASLCVASCAHVGYKVWALDMLQNSLSCQELPWLEYECNAIVLDSPDKPSPSRMLSQLLQRTKGDNLRNDLLRLAAVLSLVARCDSLADVHSDAEFVVDTVTLWIDSAALSKLLKLIVASYASSNTPIPLSVVLHITSMLVSHNCVNALAAVLDQTSGIGCEYALSFSILNNASTEMIEELLRYASAEWITAFLRLPYTPISLRQLVQVEAISRSINIDATNVNVFPANDVYSHIAGGDGSTMPSMLRTIYIMLSSPKCSEDTTGRLRDDLRIVFNYGLHFGSMFVLTAAVNRYDMRVIMDLRTHEVLSKQHILHALALSMESRRHDLVPKLLSLLADDALDSALLFNVHYPTLRDLMAENFSLLCDSQVYVKASQLHGLWGRLFSMTKLFWPLIEGVFGNQRSRISASLFYLACRHAEDSKFTIDHVKTDIIAKISNIYAMPSDDHAARMLVAILRHPSTPDNPKGLYEIAAKTNNLAFFATLEKFQSIPGVRHYRSYFVQCCKQSILKLDLGSLLRDQIESMKPLAHNCTSVSRLTPEPSSKHTAGSQ